MSHKDFVSQWNKFVYQDKKTDHYKTLDNLLKELFGERVKENGLFQQIKELEDSLQIVRDVIREINKDSTCMISRSFPRGGWYKNYNHTEALDILSVDQKNLLRDIETVKTQNKLCCEHQIELEKKIRGLPIWTQVLEKEGQKIQH